MRPPLLTRLGAAMKAARMQFSGMGGQPYTTSAYPWPSFLPGTRRDLQQDAGDPWRNSAVSICLNWIADNFPEPETQVVTTSRDGEQQPVPDHPLVALLKRPNPHYDGDALWAATITSYCVSGNAFWLKARAAGVGAPVELWYVPHWQVIPQWPQDGSQFISHYLFRVNGKADQRLELDDVVHFRFGLDLYNQRSGVARLGPCLSEIVTLNEANTYTRAILSNMGVPGVMISPGTPEDQIPEPERDRIRREWAAKYTGDGRGLPSVAERQVKVEKIAFSPEELALDRLPQRAEATICAALRVPAMVAGLNVGNEQRTYANYGEARRAAYEDCLMPLQARFAGTLDHALLPDLGNPDTEQVRWDYEHVRALAEDEDAKANRATGLFLGGLVTRNEGRVMVGRKEIGPAGEVYFLPKGGALVTEDGEEVGAPEPAPPPMLPAGGAPPNGNGHVDPGALAQLAGGR